MNMLSKFNGIFKNKPQSPKQEDKTMLEIKNANQYLEAIKADKLDLAAGWLAEQKEEADLSVIYDQAEKSIPQGSEGYEQQQQQRLIDHRERELFWGAYGKFSGEMDLDRALRIVNESIWPGSKEGRINRLADVAGLSVEEIQQKLQEL